MRHTSWSVASLVLLTGTTSGSPDVATLERAVQEAIKKAEPSVACVLVSRSAEYRKWEEPPSRDDPPGKLGSLPVRLRDEALRKKLDLAHPDHVPESYGSGVVVDRAGLILTCAHVVRGATKVFVRLPGRVEGYADIHSLDGRSDLAVLRLLGTHELKPISFGDADALKKGQFVVALSNPFAAGFRDGEPSASTGIVSHLRRRVINLPDEKDRRNLCLHNFGLLVQTDARLNLGCSGGALVNLKGELAGVLTARAALIGVETPGGFALPMTGGLQRIVDVLKRGEEVEYGFLGVRFRDTEAKGVQVEEAILRSPAQLAGLKRGDYLLSVDGVPVQSSDDVFVRIGTALTGNTVEIERAASLQGPGEKVRVTLSKYYVPLPSIASKRPSAVAGLHVDHTSLVVQRGAVMFFAIPAGVLIRDVETGSPADRARLQPDKIITHVNGTAVSSPREFYRAMRDARGSVELTLLRPEGGPDRVTLKLD
jgi:serine protease Do